MNNDDLVSSLSLHQQRYIETIFELCIEHEHDHAHSKAIAEKLNIKMPSVTEALRTLSGLGLINYQVRKAITLTDRGNQIAETLDRRHKNLASFFIGILGCDSVRANHFACDIEHVIDGDLSNRISAFSEYMDKNTETDANIFEDFKKQYIPEG